MTDSNTNRKHIKHYQFINNRKINIIMLNKNINTTIIKR